VVRSSSDGLAKIELSAEELALGDAYGSTYVAVLTTASAQTVVKDVSGYLTNPANANTFSGSLILDKTAVAPGTLLLRSTSVTMWRHRCACSGAMRG